MIEVSAWALAAVLIAIVCVLFWFFLKLFFRLALVSIAAAFLLAFLYQFSLLPESLSNYMEEAFHEAQKIVQGQSMERVVPEKKS